MKKIALIIVIFTLFGLNESFAQVQLKTKLDSVAYSIGMQLGGSLKQDNITINPDILRAGVADALNGTPVLTENEMASVMQSLSAELQAKQKEEMAKQAEEALAKGEAFLAENKNKEGVITTASGLQYQVITEGTGASPVATDTVEVHYEGTLLDGTVFDSSVQRGEPVSFPLDRVIPGWTEGVQLMKEGGKYKFFIPSNLGYGERGAQGAIGPNETLIFEVELLEVRKDSTK